MRGNLPLMRVTPNQRKYRGRRPYRQNGFGQDGTDSPTKKTAAGPPSTTYPELRRLLPDLTYLSIPSFLVFLFITSLLSSLFPLFPSLPPPLSSFQLSAFFFLDLVALCCNRGLALRLEVFVARCSIGSGHS